MWCNFSYWFDILLFLYEKKEKKSEKNTDINIEIPATQDNKDFLSLPDNTGNQMNANEYNALL